MLKKMKKLRFLVCALLIGGGVWVQPAQAQEDGVGLRLGEPLSVTYKKFLDEFFALELMIGSAGPNSQGYYQRAFERRPTVPNAFYGGHSHTGGFSINLRGMIHEDFTGDFGISEGVLLGYVGAGAQLRSIGVNYLYTDPSINPNIPLRDRRTNIDFGGEIFGGGEYYFDELPISVFAEVGLFLQVLDRFGHLRLQGAIGVRYLLGR